MESFVSLNLTNNIYKKKVLHKDIIIDKSPARSFVREEPTGDYFLSLTYQIIKGSESSSRT